MFVQPANNDEGGDATKDCAHFGQPDQLIVWRRWYRCHGRTVKPVVARSRQLVKCASRVHSSTVPQSVATFQSPANGNISNTWALVTICLPRSICVAEVLPFCDGIKDWFQTTYV